jgi:hypothetical protein
VWYLCAVTDNPLLQPFMVSNPGFSTPVENSVQKGYGGPSGALSCWDVLVYY